MVSLQGFIPTKPAALVYEYDNPRTAFMDELQSYSFSDKNGRPLPPVPEIGKVVRMMAADDKKGKESGWYWYDEFPDDFKVGALIGVGVFGSWKNNPERVVWTSKRKDSMSPAESMRLDEQMKAAKIARDIELEAKRKVAAAKAQVIWGESSEAPESHPYLVAKGVKPNGTRVSQGKIVVPVMNDGSMVSLQLVDIEGGKKFLSGGKTKGGYFVIGDKSPTIYVAEGFATGATLHEASGDCCYISFNANNLLDVATMAKRDNPESLIVIAGDDDHNTDGNPGRTKAVAAGDVLRCKVIFPIVEDKDTDFNDMAKRDGITEVRDLLLSKPKVYEKVKANETLPDHLLDPPGILGDISGWYNSSARAPQFGFAVQTALALSSIVLGRAYRTDKDNYPSIYLLNVAKSGTGKEHCKTVIEAILEAAGLDDWLNGSGYTSAGAVFSTLLRLPKHLTIVDEFGRSLEAATAGNNSNAHDANTQLMEAIGRTQGMVKPTAYSTMTLTAEKAKGFADRKCYNPAITLVAMTTPVSLYKALTADNVADGFLGRFIIQQSFIPRQVHDEKTPTDVPHSILAWIEKVLARSNQVPGVQGFAAERPIFIQIPFTSPALKVIKEFNQYCVDLADKLEPMGMEALPGRSKEMAMKVSLIVALAKNPDCSNIDENDIRWSIDYVKFCLDQAVDVFKMKISGSAHEGNKKEVLGGIRDKGANGVTWMEMQKRPPFSKHKPRDLKEILSSLVDAGLISREPIARDKPGRPREAYIAIN